MLWKQDSTLVNDTQGTEETKKGKKVLEMHKRETTHAYGTAKQF